MTNQTAGGVDMWPWSASPSDPKNLDAPLKAFIGWTVRVVPQGTITNPMVVPKRLTFHVSKDGLIESIGIEPPKTLDK